MSWRREEKKEMRCENETEKENCEKRRRREGVKKATTRDGWADGGLMKGLMEWLRGSLKENIREQKCVRSHVAERERDLKWLSEGA